MGRRNDDGDESSSDSHSSSSSADTAIESDGIVLSELSSDTSEYSDNEFRIPRSEQVNRGRSSTGRRGSTMSEAKLAHNTREKEITGSAKKDKDDHDWEMDPELYGIRRSGRTRQVPDRYIHAFSSSEDSESGSNSDTTSRKRKRLSIGGRKTKISSKGRKLEKKSSKGRSSTGRRTKGIGMETVEDYIEQTDSESDSDWGASGSKKAHAKPKVIRTKRRKRVKAVTSEDEAPQPQRLFYSSRGQGPVKYAEADTDEDDDDLLSGQSGAEDESAAVADTRPNIDKVMIAKGRDELDKIDVDEKYIGAIPVSSTNTELRYETEKDEKIIEEESDIMYYNIKWLGMSHRHNTWNTADQLKTTCDGQGVKGLGKLHNFIADDSAYRTWLKTAPREDVEYSEVDREMVLELVKTHLTLERVVAQKEVKDREADVECDDMDDDDDDDGPTRQAFLCKWAGLPYGECTWEYAEEIEDDQTLIDAFLDREVASTMPVATCAALRKRPKFKEIKTQPKYIGHLVESEQKKNYKNMEDDDEVKELRMRDYQLEGLNWICHSWCAGNSAILADEMGLGKTIQSVAFLAYLFHTHKVYGPFLVVVPLSTLPAWQRAFEEWTPDLNVVTYLGNKESRQLIRDYEFYTSTGARKVKFNVLLTSYEIVVKDAQVLLPYKWASLLVDEAHRLKNHESQLHNVLCEFNTNHRLLITGTPLQNSLKELWALLKFIEPKQFAMFDDFVEEYGTDLQSSNIQKLHKDLKTFMIRRVKKDVEKSLPNKVERILSVDMGSLQREYYRLIINKNYSVLRTGKNRGSLLNTMIEMKKCCNHPFLVREPEYAPEDGQMTAKERNIERLNALVKNSGKLVLLDKLLVRLQETGHRVLIFSQMVRMLDIISEYLQLRGFTFQRLDGCTKNEQRTQAMDHFNAPRSEDFCFILSTRAGGLGINLATADTVIIFDSDWNPQNDLQAEARAHRIGQKKVVNIYRLVTKDSVEETVLQRAKQKLVLDHVVIQSMDSSGHAIVGKAAGGSSVPFDKSELSAMMKIGAESLYEEDGDTKATKTLEEMDLDAILSRADVLAQEEDRSATADFLSQFNTVNFVMDQEKEWEQIIPEHTLEKIVQEEETRRFEEDEKDRYANIIYEKRQRKTVIYADGIVPDSQPATKAKQKSKGAGTTKAQPKRSASLDSEAVDEGDAKRILRGVRKFGNVVCRLDDIANETGMGSKRVADMQDIALRYLADYEMAENETQNSAHVISTSKQPDEQADPPSSDVAVGVHSGVPLKTLQELARRDRDTSELGSRLSSFNRFRLHGIRGVQKWACKWGVADDARLMYGVYKWGLNNWETVKDDPECMLADKVLQDEGVPPQVSHLQQRGQSLLKHLAQAGQSKASLSTNREKKSEKKHKSHSGINNVVDKEDHESMFIEECKKNMYLVRKNLKAMGKLSQNDDWAKDTTLIKHLLAVGDHIQSVVRNINPEEEAVSANQRFWRFSANYSPIEDPIKLEAYYKRQAEKGKSISKHGQNFKTESHKSKISLKSSKSEKDSPPSPNEHMSGSEDGDRYGCMTPTGKERDRGNDERRRSGGDSMNADGAVMNSKRRKSPSKYNERSKERGERNSGKVSVREKGEDRSPSPTPVLSGDESTSGRGRERERPREYESDKTHKDDRERKRDRHHDDSWHSHTYREHRDRDKTRERGGQTASSRSESNRSSKSERDDRERDRSTTSSIAKHSDTRYYDSRDREWDSQSSYSHRRRSHGSGIASGSMIRDHRHSTNGGTGVGAIESVNDIHTDSKEYDKR
eukprot:CFRG8587T1